jgi:hydrogenase expression/formation protein HypE
MSAREGLSFETSIESDSAPVFGEVNSLLEAGIDVHCLRDATRGGLATVLVELAEGSSSSSLIEESKIPVCDSVRGACEILGLDPLYVANEGRFVAYVSESHASRALTLLQAHNPSASIIGYVEHGRSPSARLKNRIGTIRPIDMLSGEQLPRIC